jgi:serine/threonine protein kinase/tetratricopeptide (TPR) repeat protein
MTAPLLNHRYRILQSLGEGGFGKTFLAEDTQMPSLRRCVIKQLKPMSDRPSIFALLQQRFDREAAVLEAVGKGHSQIPDLYAYFSEHGQFYLVQEWIEGQPLSAIPLEGSAIAPSTWTEERVNALLIDTLGALAHVHSQNIIHRDIKPDNIILRKSDQLPCLIDFGAVKELMSTVMSPSGAQESSIVIGTPGFMPAEQAAGRPTFASDIYSLAMTMIYLLTGRSPAELPTDSSNGRVLWQQFAPDISTRLASVLTRAIHPYFQTRYTTANDMLAALKLPPSGQFSTSQFSTSQLTTGPTATGPTATGPTATGQSAASQQPPVGLPAGASNVPTVVVSPAGQSTAVTGATPSQPVGMAVNNPVSSSQKQAVGLPWKRMGLAAGALVLGMGVLIGLRPQISLESSSSEATLSDFQTEIAALEKALKSTPNDATTQVELADNYREVGKYDQALAQITPLLKQTPDNAAALITQGDVQFAKGDYAGAIASTTQAIDRGEPSAEAYNLRGDAYYETGEYTKAIADYRSALRVDPKNAKAYVNWSAVNVVQGNPQEALQNLDLAVKNDPTLISAYVNRGSRRAELGNVIGAAQDWQKAIALSPQTANEYASRGYAKSRMGNKKGAIDDNNQALIINPNLARAHMNRAYVAYEEGNKESALQAIEEALAINPNLVTGLILKGEILAFQTNPDWQAALAAYSKALAVNPNDPSVLNNRCGAYFSTKQLELALTDCDKGLKIDPNSAALYLARGNIRLAMENYEGAVQDYSRTLEISEKAGGDPRKEQPAYSNRASALVNLQDLEGALADLDKALELKDDAPEDYYKRGVLKVTLEDREGGEADLRKAADLYVEQGRTDSHQNTIATMEKLGF